MSILIAAGNCLLKNIDVSEKAGGLRLPKEQDAILSIGKKLRKTVRKIIYGKKCGDSTFLPDGRRS